MLSIECYNIHIYIDECILNNIIFIMYTYKYKLVECYMFTYVCLQIIIHYHRLYHLHITILKH